MKPQSFTPKAFMLIMYLLFYVTLSATEFIHEGFDSGTVAPPGWIIKVSGTYTSASGSGEALPSLKFANNGDYIETPEFSGATECSFMIKGYSIDSLSSLNIFTYDGIDWTRIDSINHITSTKKVIIKPLSASAKKIRFVYHKGKGNLAFDDVIVKNNEIVPDLTPPVFLKEPKFSYSSDSVALFHVSIDKPGEIYFLITSDNCTVPDTSQILKPHLYDSTCLIISGNYILKLNTDTTIKINGLLSGTKYVAYWLAALGEKTSGISSFFAVNFSFPRTNYDLFFSEIDKGTGYNKAIEVYNPSSDTTYLNNYRIASSTNGGGWKTTYYKFPAGSKLNPNDVFVILKANADTTVVNFSVADDSSNSAMLGFTGNDALGLQITNDNGITWRFIDVFGYPDSSTVFDIAGIEGAAGKGTFIRKKYIRHGNTDWTISSGTNEKNSEWIVLKQNDFSNLGNHLMMKDTSLFFTDIILENQEKSPLIDSIDHIIYFSLHSESDVKNLLLTFKIPEDVSITPDPFLIKDYSVSRKFVLSNIGQTISTEWTINASIDDAPDISSLNIEEAESGKIKIVLTESINISDLANKPSIILSETATGEPILVNISYEQDNKVILIKSQVELRKGTTYTITIDSVSDEYNNVMPSYEWTFTVPGTNNLMTDVTEEVKIFPNPSNEFVTISIPKNYSKNIFEIKIFTLEGRLVLANKFKNSEETRLDISKLKSGLYMLTVAGNSFEFRVHLLKRK